MKKFGKIAAMLAVVLAAALALTACGTASKRVEGESAFVTIDINPSIELVLDEKGTVLSVGAGNADAEVMLWQEEGIIGAHVDVAVENIATLAVEMGYLTEDNAAISVTVATESGEGEEALYKDIDKQLAESAAKAGVEVHIEQALDLVLTRELERVKEQKAGVPGYDDTLTVSRFRLVKSALRADRELTMDEAVLKTNEELTDIVSTAQADAAAKFGEACEVARLEAEFIYYNAKQTLLDSAYTAVYVERKDLSSVLGNRGAAYAGYRLAHRTIEHYSETLRRLIEDPIFTSDDVFALANALGIDTSAEAEYEAFKQAITDENGDITRDSVNAYIDQLYRNMDEADREKLEAAYDGVLDILDRLGAEASVITEDGMTTINGALLGLDISVSVKTYEDIPALLAAIQEKIDATYAEMEADLSDEEKARVQELQDGMNEKLAGFEQTYREAVEQAQAKAEAYLTAAKQERTGNAVAGEE